MSGSLTVNVNKVDLLATLKANREEHGATYEKAKAGYLKVTKNRLDELLAKIVEGELLDRIFLEAPPVDNTGDYDDVIEMMKWSQDDNIQLTQGQFKQYIQDDWGWKDSWMVSNTSYLQA